MVEYAVALLAIALVILWFAARKRKLSGIPSGRIIYSDTSHWGKVEKPLYDPLSGLTGRPDYLVEENGAWIPVEVKSSRAPALPHDSHIFQLAAYCLLVERTTEKRPPYGIIKYHDRTFSIEFTPELQNELLTLLETIRNQSHKKELARSHQEPGRCRHCGFRDLCDQRL